jgi:hypothetical protein
VPIRLTVSFGCLFSPLADFAAVDDHVVSVPLTGNLDLTERDELGFHGRFSSLGRFMSLTAIGVGC